MTTEKKPKKGAPKRKATKDEDSPSSAPQIYIVDPFSAGPRDQKPRRVYLYGDLEEERAAEVVSTLLTLQECGEEEVHEDPADIDSPVKEIVYKPIDFYISSFGGSAADMFSIYDVMHEIKETCDIRTVGLGKVMSAGVLLLAAGTKGQRRIARNCRVMIHSVAGGQWGPIYNLENEMEEMHYLQQQYTKAIVSETNMSERYLKKLLNRKVNVYLSAEEAVEHGIADELY